jgi:hypothetical protein
MSRGELCALTVVILLLHLPTTLATGDVEQGTSVVDLVVALIPTSVALVNVIFESIDRRIRKRRKRYWDLKMAAAREAAAKHKAPTQLPRHNHNKGTNHGVYKRQRDGAWKQGALSKQGAWSIIQMCSFWSASSSLWQPTLHAVNVDSAK